MRFQDNEVCDLGTDLRMTRPQKLFDVGAGRFVVIDDGEYLPDFGQR